MSDMWPSWRYGPNAAADIFQCAEDVPEGWADSPDRVVSMASLPEYQGGGFAIESLPPLKPKNKGGRPRKNP